MQDVVGVGQDLAQLRRHLVDDGRVADERRGDVHPPLSVLEFTDPADAWKALGDGYRVEARIVTWEAPDVLKVSTGALVRAGDQWAVYALIDGRAHQVPVTLGHQNGQEAEITSGIEVGTEVIMHPGDTIAEGVRVEKRQL